MNLDGKYQKLLSLLASCEGLAVAYSGGLDSGFLLTAAREALGERLLALTVDSVFIPRSELRDAVSFCEAYGIRHRVLAADVLSLPEVAGNPPERCYSCKRNIFTLLRGAAEKEGFSILADGTNADDPSDVRPGMRALRELGVRSPLLEAGLGKAEIRALSEKLGLSFCDKPSAACLASRVAYGEPLTLEKLRTVESAENLLHAKGIRQCRVRLHGKTARIEVLPSDFECIIREDNRRAICEMLRQQGIVYVSLDLEGFRSGSMNEVLPKK